MSVDDDQLFAHTLDAGVIDGAAAAVEEAAATISAHATFHIACGARGSPAGAGAGVAVVGHASTAAALAGHGADAAVESLAAAVADHTTLRVGLGTGERHTALAFAALVGSVSTAYEGIRA